MGGNAETAHKHRLASIIQSGKFGEVITKAVPIDGVYSDARMRKWHPKQPLAPETTISSIASVTRATH